MSPDELVQEVDRLGIVLEVCGETLHITAPAGAVTPMLRAELLRHKPALLALLTPVTEFVRLKNGLTLPLPALQLAWRLEEHGFRLSVNACQQFAIEPMAELSDADRMGIRRWRRHLAAIVQYECPPEEFTQ